MSAAASEGILGWLNGAIGAREQTAFNALNRERGADWQANGESVQVAGGFDPDSDVFKETVVFGQGSPSAEQAQHVAANDPASVLRRCAADRKLLELHQPATVECDDDSPTTEACRTCGSHFEYPTAWPCLTLIALAEGYGWTGGNR